MWLRLLWFRCRGGQPKSEVKKAGGGLERLLVDEHFAVVGVVVVVVMG